MNVRLFSNSDGRKRAKVTQQLRVQCLRRGVLQLSVQMESIFQQKYQATKPVLSLAEIESWPDQN